MCYNGTFRFKKLDDSFWNGETFRFADYISPTFAPLDIKFPARLRTGKSALLPASGHKRSCPPPESAKLRDFFCTPQRAGIQRVTSVSRENPENFS